MALRLLCLLVARKCLLGGSPGDTSQHIAFGNQGDDGAVAGEVVGIVVDVADDGEVVVRDHPLTGDKVPRRLPHQVSGVPVGSEGDAGGAWAHVYTNMVFMPVGEIELILALDVDTPGIWRPIIGYDASLALANISISAW